MRSSPPLATALLAVCSVLALQSCYPARPPSSGTSVDGDADTDADIDFDDHGENWSQPGEHGLASKLQDSECGTCHGDDLLGGSAGVDCDVCHPADWRTDCTWCHGGVDDSSGAPPLDMDDSANGISFPEHGAHVQRLDHPAYGCAECHLRPVDVLSVGHLFTADDTPALAELTFAQGMSPAGSYGRSGSCSNLYCHGNGRSGGAASSGENYGCNDCHRKSALSGEHDEHLEEGVDCDDCHGDTVDRNDNIVGPDRHVDGDVDLAMDELSWNGNSCDGDCHGEGHDNEHW